MDLKTKIEEMKHLADEMLDALEGLRKAAQDPLPRSLKEVNDIDKQHYTNAKVVSDVYLAFCALSDLFILRKAYWVAAGNWEPDWRDENQIKYSIEVYREVVVKDSPVHFSRFLAFPTEEQRDHFLRHHSVLIKQAKPLL